MDYFVYRMLAVVRVLEGVLDLFVSFLGHLEILGVDELDYFGSGQYNVRDCHHDHADIEVESATMSELSVKDNLSDGSHQ